MSERAQKAAIRCLRSETQLRIRLKDDASTGIALFEKRFVLAKNQAEVREFGLAFAFRELWDSCVTKPVCVSTNQSKWSPAPRG